MLTYESFKKSFCTFDIGEPDKMGNVSVTVIASCGIVRDFSKEFVKEHEETAKDLVANDIWDYINHQIKGK